MWQLYCQDGAAGAEFRQLQSSQGAVRAWAWNMSRMLMRHLATQPQPLALSADCQPPLLDSLRSLHPILTHTLSRSARSASVWLKIINMQCNGCSGGPSICILSSRMLGLVVFMSNMKHLMTCVMIYQLFTQFVMLREKETRESRNSYCHPCENMQQGAFPPYKKQAFQSAYRAPTQIHS